MILHHHHFCTPKEECSTAQSARKSTVCILSWPQRYEAFSKPKAHEDNSAGSVRNPTGHCRLKTSPKPPCCCSSVVQSCLTLCNPMDCSQPDSSVHGIFQGWNTGVGCHFLLQGIFLIQGSNPYLLQVSCTASGSFFLTTEPPGKPPKFLTALFPMSLQYKGQNTVGSIPQSCFSVHLLVSCITQLLWHLSLFTCSLLPFLSFTFPLHWSLLPLSLYTYCP